MQEIDWAAIVREMRKTAQIQSDLANDGHKAVAIRQTAATAAIVLNTLAAAIIAGVPSASK